MLMDAPFSVRVEAMMTWMPGRAASSCGSAVMPSITGISISSTTTSISVRVTSSTASLPLLAVATTLIDGSLLRERDTKPRIT
jgi:hypothetical protein